MSQVVSHTVPTGVGTKIRTHTHTHTHTLSLSLSFFLSLSESLSPGTRSTPVTSVSVQFFDPVLRPVVASWDWPGGGADVRFPRGGIDL